ncbi:tetratricopeptide repeat protein [Streptomyces massasporeus]
MSRHNLAVAMQGIGRHHEAAALHSRNLADRERILGPERPETVQSRAALARAERNSLGARRWIQRPWRTVRWWGQR